MTTNPQEFMLRLTQEEVNTCFAALQDMPWRVANAIIFKVNKQMADQMPKTGEATPVPKAVAKPDAPTAETERETPRTNRRVQDEPDPLPTRSRGNGRDPGANALAPEDDGFAERAPR